MDETETLNTELSTKRFPKHRVALLFGYCGTGYSGLQMNPNCETIEKALITALVSVNLISESNAIDPSRKSGWQRCARTDKGVHAAGQLVSFKMNFIPMNESTDSDFSSKEYEKFIVELINSALPETIRVWGFMKVANKFNAKNNCHGREYAYLMPTYLLRGENAGTDNSEPNIHLDKQSLNQFKSDPKLFSSKFQLGKIIIEDLETFTEFRNCIRNSYHSIWGDSISKTKEESDLLKKENEPLTKKQKVSNDEETIISSCDTQIVPDENDILPDGTEFSSVSDIPLPNFSDFRLSAEELIRLRSALKLYEGSHCFHNYTVNLPFWDPSSNRVMRSVTVIDCTDPFVWEGIEYIEVQLYGQSFMLHQIRKMMGMIILCMRTNTPMNVVIPLSYGKCRLNIPKAPAVGLLLEKPLFNSYNKLMGFRMANNETKSKEADISFDPYLETMNLFKRNMIHAHMIKQERENNDFWNWLKLVERTAFDYGFLTPSGIIHNTYYELAKIGTYDIARKKERDATKQQEKKNNLAKRKYSLHSEKPNLE